MTSWLTLITGSASVMSTFTFHFTIMPLDRVNNAAPGSLDSNAIDGHHPHGCGRGGAFDFGRGAQPLAALRHVVVIVVPPVVVVTSLRGRRGEGAPGVGAVV